MPMPVAVTLHTEPANIERPSVVVVMGVDPTDAPASLARLGAKSTGDNGPAHELVRLVGLGVASASVGEESSHGNLGGRSPAGKPESQYVLGEEQVVYDPLLKIVSENRGLAV